MHLKKESSRSNRSKRHHAELDTYTPNELTDGLNRLSVNRYQKLARKSARDFVKSEPSISTPLTPMQQHGESIRFMDFLVQTTVDKHSKNLEVRALAQKYSDAPQTPAAKAVALTQFEKNSQVYIEKEQMFNAGVEMGYATSTLCSQVAIITKNKELSRFANGIGAMTQAVNGINQIAQASAMMSQAAAASSAAATTTAVTSAAASGASAMASGAMMLGAVGAVVAAGIMIYSMCSEEEEADNGLGYALTAIHSTVMAMWEDMRAHFAEVFKQLDIIDKKITEMERQNWKRFVAQMKAIHYYGESTREQLKDLKTAVQGAVNHLHDGMKSYLNEITDETAITMLDTIRLEGPEETIKHLSDRIPQLAYWLNKKATIKDHAGRIDTPFGKLDVDSETLTRELKKTITSDTIESLSYPLGLFASIAMHVDPTILPKKALTQMINTQDWNRVLECYLDVIRLGLSTISTLDPKQQDAYLDITRKIKDKPLLILEFLSNLVDSDKLWLQLINDYYHEVIHIQHQINEILEQKYQEWSQDDAVLKCKTLDILVSTEDHFNFNCSIPKDEDVFLKHIDNCSHYLRHNSHLSRNAPDPIPSFPLIEGDMHGALLKRKIEVVLTGETNKKFQPVCNQGLLYIAKAMKIAFLCISQYVQNSELEESLNPVLDQFTIYMNFIDSAENVENKRRLTLFFGVYSGSYQLMFKSMSTVILNCEPTPVPNYCNTIQMMNQRVKYHVFEQNIFKELNKQLQRKRTEVGHDISTRIDTKQLECVRLKLLSFIALLNPDFKFDLSGAQNTIQGLIKKLVTRGSLGSLKNLLSSEFAASLLQADLGYPISLNCTVNTANAMVKNRVREKSLHQHPLWQTMAHAYASIEMLEQTLVQAQLMEARLEENQIEEMLAEGMLLLASHHQQFSDGLQTMRSVIKQAQALVSTQAISETTLIEQTKALRDLEEKFTYRMDAAIDLNQKISTDYEAPDVDLTSIETPIALSEKKKALFAQRWMKKADSMVKFSFPETIRLLKKGLKEFHALPKTNAPAVLFVGKTQVGKSTLANAVTDVLYELAQNQFGRPCVRKSSASIVDEYAKTGQGQASETILPNVKLSPDGTCYLVDMPGYQDTRNTPHRISTGVAFQCIQEHYKEMKGVVIVCEENEFLMNGFGSLRTTLENVGRILPAYTDGANNHVILAVTNSRGEATQESFLTVLRTLLTTEYASAITADRRAVKRALLYLTQSADKIVLVNAENLASVAEFYQKIKDMDVSAMSQFNLTPSSDAMSLIKIVLQTITSAERELTHRINQLQGALKKQCKSQLLISMEISHELAQLQSDLQASLSLLDDAEGEILLEFTGLVEDQKALVRLAVEVMGTLSHLFNTADERKETANAQELIEKYTELEMNQPLFNRIREIDLMLSDTQGYETDDEAEALFEQDTRDYLANEPLIVAEDVDEDSDDENEPVEKQIWVKPDETAGRRTLQPAFQALAQRPAFLQFFNEKGYAVMHVDEEISVQLCTKMSDL